MAVRRLVEQILVRIVAAGRAVLGRIGARPERHAARRRGVVQVVRVVPGLALQGLQHPEHVHRQLAELHLRNKPDAVVRWDVLLGKKFYICFLLYILLMVDGFRCNINGFIYVSCKKMRKINEID